MPMSLELWLYTASNLVVLLLGGSIAGLSLLAYLRNRSQSFLLSTAGFALITAGSLADAFYDIVVFDDVTFTFRELLVLQTVAGTLTAIGLGLLFYSISRS